MCRGLCFIGLLLLFGIGPVAAESTRAVKYPNAFIARNIDNTNGLNSNMVLGISQERPGYIWIGTEKGLQRYDGLRFMNCFGPQARPQSLYVSDLFPDDAHGRLLFTQREGRLMQWDYLLHTSAPMAGASAAQKEVYTDEQQGHW